MDWRKTFWLVLAFLVLRAHAAEARVYKLKVATLMPRGTTWMRYLNKFKYNVRRRTGNAVRFVFYAGGVAGDEKDAVRKMRMGQIHGAGMTSVGMGLVLPAVRVLELPLLFKRYREADYVRKKMRPTFNALFAAKGYKLLAWAASGWVYLYSGRNVRTMPEIKRARVWRWIDDPVVPVILRELGLKGVPLGVPDVLPSLQTGIIDTVYGMAQSTLALQWHTKLKYILDIRIDMAVGGLILKKAVFDALPLGYQKVVLKEAGRLEAALDASSRKVNRSSLKAMMQAGLIRIRPPARLMRFFERAAVRVQNRLAGRLYSRQLLKQVRGHLKRCRTSGCTP